MSDKPKCGNMRADAALKRPTKPQTADGLSRYMSERARKILNGEPVEPVLPPTNCY